MKQFSVTIDKRQPGSSRVKKDTLFDGCFDNPLFSNCTCALARSSLDPRVREFSVCAREREEKKVNRRPAEFNEPHAEFIAAG